MTKRTEFHVTVETDDNDAIINVNQMYGMLWILVQPNWDSSFSLGLNSASARMIADGLYEAARRADRSLAEYTAQNGST